MEDLGKNAQKELIKQIGNVVADLEEEEYFFEGKFEWIEQYIQKKRKKRKEIIYRWNRTVANLSDIDKLVINLYNIDEDNEMIAYYLLSMSEWVETLKELKPKVKAAAESGFWTRLFKKEVTLKQFKSKALRMISLDSIIANQSSAAEVEKEGVAMKEIVDVFNDPSVVSNLSGILQRMGIQAEDDNEPTAEPRKKKLSIKKENL